MYGQITQIDYGSFLLTPLREGRPKLPSSKRTLQPFLLTPLREGRQHIREAIVFGAKISTHAPAGGAT